MVDLGLRARRLDRIRASSRGGTVADEPRDRAAAMAEQLGGRAVRSPRGTVVVVEAEQQMPLRTALLARLPWPVDVTRPLAFLDTETTGLGTAAGSLAFLVGIGVWDGDTLRVQQLVLPDHPDEPALLDAVAAAVPPDAWLVTYNGRSFDWPLLVTRYRLDRRPAPAHAGHLDLLPVARALWRHRLPDARLATVERALARVRRVDDLPGEQIPPRYLAWLRTGDAAPLVDVLDHNREDVVSLARLLVELVDRYLDPSVQRRPHPGDLGGLGRAYLRRGRTDEALGCFDAAIDACHERLGDGWHDPGDLDLLQCWRARTLRRLGRRSDAAAAWLGVAERGGPLAARAWIQVAKHREHDRGDVEAAIAAATRAYALAERSRLLGRPDPLVTRDLPRRLGRLRRRAPLPVRRVA